MARGRWFIVCALEPRELLYVRAWRNRAARALAVRVFRRRYRRGSRPPPAWLESRYGADPRRGVTCLLYPPPDPGRCDPPAGSVTEHVPTD